MAFQEAAWGSSQQGQAAGAGSDKVVEHGIFRLHTGLGQASREVDKLGSKADTQELRDKLKQRLHGLKADAMHMGERVRELHGSHPSEKTAKLTRHLQDALKQLSRVMDAAESKQAASLPRRQPQPQQAAAAGAALQGDLEAGAGGEQQALLQQQKQREETVFVSQVEHQEGLIQEQHEGIEQIHRDLQEVHGLFHEMATLVNDQGHMIDDIEANVTRTAVRVQEGTHQLVKADASQRSARSKKCMLLAIALIVLVILLAVLLS